MVLTVPLTIRWPGTGQRPRSCSQGSPEHEKHLDFGNDRQVGCQEGLGGAPAALGIHVRTRLLEERLLPQGEPSAFGARGGVVIVAVPADREAGVSCSKALALRTEPAQTS